MLNCWQTVYYVAGDIGLYLRAIISKKQCMAGVINTTVLGLNFWVAMLKFMSDLVGKLVLISLMVCKNQV